MYAIVKIGGMQWKAEESAILRVPRMDVEPGKTVQVEDVLLLVNNDQVEVGKPVVQGATVQIKVMAHGKDKKVKVFKKKRRKTYQVMNGHRQGFTEVQVEKITLGKPAASETKKTAKSSEPAEAAPKKAAAKPKTAIAKSEKAAAATSTTAAKKPAAKKPAAKSEKAASGSSATAAKKPAAKKAAPKKTDSDKTEE